MRRLAALTAGCLWVCARLYSQTGSQTGSQADSQASAQSTGPSSKEAIKQAPTGATTNAGGPDADAATQHAMLLIHISQQMMANLKRAPNYTCLETVERSHRLASSHKLELMDTIRLEVALVDGKEMFGWPGAKKFENTELRDIVGGGGAIANGDFALHARAIFGSGTPVFEYRGTGEAANRPWVRYDYHVEVARSGFELRNGDLSAIVAYHGSFEADPTSLDVERIDVIADDVPTSLGIRRTSDHLEYSRVRIGESDFLLPSASELTMFNLDGTEYRNQVHFSSCRQFSGESVLSFGDAPTSSADAPAHVEDIELPADLDLTVALVDDIDLTKAAIGDPVRARLQNDLKSKGHVLVPKNATVSGRLTRLERHSDYLMLGLTFDELESPGVRAHARMQMFGVYGADRIPYPRNNYLLSERKPEEGIIPVSIGRKRLSHGLTMLWSTQP
jgi:hypothetical protein